MSLLCFYNILMDHGGCTTRIASIRKFAGANNPFDTATKPLEIETLKKQKQTKKNIIREPNKDVCAEQVRARTTKVHSEMQLIQSKQGCVAVNGFERK